MCKISDALLVIIESPYAGDIAGNVAYAKECMLDSLSRGEAPFASHLLYPQVLDDAKPKERAWGIMAGLSWALGADHVAVYTDLGISPGMQQGIDRHTILGVPIVYRKIRG